MENLSVSIIGIGRVGGALALALSKKKYRINYLVARDFKKAANLALNLNKTTKIISPDELDKINSDIIFITTQDSEIQKVAERLAEKITVRPFVFHTSGALSSEILENLTSIGCQTGSIHPLVSISEAFLGSLRFANSYFCIEGNADAVKVAEKIVSDLDGNPFSIATKFKTLYHASAVTACGHLVALIDTAIEMMTKCGLETADAQKILLPLIKSTVENLSIQTTAQALTGTFARADSDTFEKHLETLEKNVSDEVIEIYLQLGMRSTHLAERQNISIERIEKIREKIMLAKKKLK
jgi:predicted short-subunit dehydrogenase-like oxidoreductase (DUF2520 family)